MTTIAILEPGYADYGTERAVLGDTGARIVPVDAKADAATALAKLDPVAILLRERIVGQAEMDACPNLKAIVRYGVGVDNIDLNAATQRLIHVANVPDYGAETEVSEHALALYLAVQRRIVSRDGEVRSGDWGIGQRAPVPDRSAATLGLIGCGRIGLATAEKFRAIGFTRIIAHDPSLTAETAETSGIEPVFLDDVFRQADVLSLHAPLTPQTRHIVNATRLAMMKHDSILLNVARGGLVDEPALAEALTKSQIFGAGIDVFETEPPAHDNPLRRAPNAVLSDHTAWYSERSVALLQRNAAQEVARILRGKAPRNWVNPWSYDQTKIRNQGHQI